MPQQDPLPIISIRFNEKSRGYFDTIENAELSNRKQDTWLIELDRPMLRPRAGTVRYADTIIDTWVSSTAYSIWDYVVHNDVVYKASAWSTGSEPPSANWTIVTNPSQSKLFFYTDRLWVRRGYRVFDSTLQYTTWSTWTNITSIGTNEVEFSIQRVPVNTTWLDSTSRTTPSVSSAAEKVKKDAWDTLNANNNVGTILLVTSGIYKGCYAPIIAYDSGASEYTLGWSGIIVALPSGTTYKRYDLITDVLQITRGYNDANELYYDGITPLTWLQGYSTDSLIQVSAFATGKWLKKMVTFNNNCWTFSGTTLFYSGWYPWNPLFFNYTGALTLGWNGSIVDIFQYKSRLIVIWTNFLFSISSSLSVDRHVTTFGGEKDAYVNTWDDVYILTSQKTLASLNETITGVIVVKNVGQDIDNFIKKYNFNICFWFDANKIFLYWEETAGFIGKMCIYDVRRKLWLIYTGLNPKSIVAEGGRVYLSDNNSDIVRYFDLNITTDVAIGTNQTSTFNMYLETKEIDLGDIFSQKVLKNVYIAFENYSQSLYMDVAMGLNRKNANKARQSIDINEVPVAWGTLWEEMIWDSTFWISWFSDIISVPVLEKKSYTVDSGNIFKIILSSKDWSPFYLTQIDLQVGWRNAQKQYFDPNHTT